MVSNPDTALSRMNPGTRSEQVIRDALTALDAHVRGMWRFRLRAVLGRGVGSSMGGRAV